MKKNQTKSVILIIGLVLGAITFSSCSKKGCTDTNATNYSSTAKKDDGSCVYSSANTNGGIRYEITSVMSDQAFKYNQAFQNIDGKTLLFTKCQLYIGNPQVTLNDTGKLSFPENVQLIKPELKTYSACYVGNGSYGNFTFQFGIDSTLNNTKNPSKYASNKAMGSQNPSMYRGSIEKYTFLLLEGKYDSNGDEVPDKAFKYHIGADKYSKRIDEYSSGFEITNNGRITIEMNLNWAYFLSGVNFSASPTSLSTDATSDLIMDNVNLAFM